MTNSTAKATKYQVFYKDWMGQWVADTKKFAQKSEAVKHSKLVGKKSENGVVAVQEVR